MNRGWALGAGGLLLALMMTPLVGAELAPPSAQSQSTELHTKFKSGQGVVPVYEGWERVPDGSFNMVFGYLNRNHVEELPSPSARRTASSPAPPIAASRRTSIRARTISSSR